MAFLLVTAAHLMSFMQREKHFNPGYYYALQVAFHFCVTYITLYSCAIYSLSDP